MLKHIRDIRSPIAVAQQKQAARKAAESPASGGQGRFSTGDSNRPNSRPPKLQIHGSHNGTTAPLMTGISEKPGWPEVMSPSVETKAEEMMSAAGTALSNGTANGTSFDTGGNDHTSHSMNRDNLPSIAAALSYAVAIYPYMAEQEDEFDVVV